MPLNLFRKNNQAKPHQAQSKPVPEPCPICDHQTYVSFNWQDAQAGKDEHLQNLTKHLLYLRPVKVGNLYQCPQDQQYWYLDEQKKKITHVPVTHNDVFLKWCERWLNLTFEQISALKAIGGMEQDRYGNGRGEIKVPCKITRYDGEVLDPALVLITNIPPLHEQRAKQFLGRQDDVIEPSDYALPLDVRIAAANAEELHAGYAPTPLKTKDGQYYILNGMQQFFMHLAVKGKDLLIPEEPFPEKEALPHSDTFLESVAHVYFDWFEGCQALLPEGI